ncbi:chorismate-binding protein [Dyadobacter sp. LHD-138]|uniref:chorismate-binding protein n=1 Tax=Dyadobacter sp. LHD-138 TaxID=3071413 RepID=UPI0027E029E6|nr:chorismate-binding protein [Dyadobacter sp. LHD-138]MDQ6476895.1 chorismate-binding protein [Dyadobacter sp. LHD-138]
MISTHIKTAQSILEQFEAEELWEAAKELGFPCALWKLPHTHEIKLLISVREGIRSCQPDLEKLSPGFIISSFHWKEQDDVLFMEGDIIAVYAENGLMQQIDNLPGEEHPEVIRLAAKAGALKKLLVAHPNPETTLLLSSLPDHDSKTRFERTVELAVSAIRQKQFHKVVLSRTKELSYTDQFQPAKAFQKLAKAYPHAFVSLVNLPDQKELWLGASPEALVQQKSDGIFKTMSLAGTQKAKDEAGNLIAKYDIRWGQKEIEEQALVSRYIVECFKKIRLREYLETGPKTVLAGNLYHLRTDFEVDTNAVNFPELSSVMLRLLHPTSAVCGVPKIPSLQFLSEIEGYDRTFYSGFLGPVQVESDSNLFVNLRTVRLKDGIATFYAGAGITEDSIPEREWEETELKCDTLLKVIGKDF